MKKPCKDRLTTVFPRQRHYATDPANLAVYPPADITIERIGDPANADLTTLFGNGTAGEA